MTQPQTVTEAVREVIDHYRAGAALIDRAMAGHCTALAVRPQALESLVLLRQASEAHAARLAAEAARAG